MTDRLPAAILGASGLIGQHFARLLEDHPWFDVVALTGSERSAGRRLSERWALESEPPEGLGALRLAPASPAQLSRTGVKVVFGALPSGTAGPTESELRRRGVHVFTNAADHRLDPDVPLLVPEVNAAHLARAARPGRALLVANPNCTATGLDLALAPVWRQLAPRRVFVATYQALSGAGLPGASALDLTDNVLPYIATEEEKVETESQRILGSVTRRGRFAPLRTPFLAQCARVGVRDGHLEAVTVEAGRSPTAEAIDAGWKEFRPLRALRLPTAPDPPVLRRTEPDRPQPLRDRWAGAPFRARGMAATVGRVRWDPPFLRFFVVSHNAVRGGAGGSVLNAELAWATGRLGPVAR